MSKALVEKLKEYIALFQAECNEMASLCHIHGWKSSRVEDGVRIRKEIAELESTPKESEDGWVAVEDRLPEIDKNVLGVVKDLYEPYVYTVRFDGTQWYRPYKNITVTHWQPLPTPPKTN